MQKRFIAVSTAVVALALVLSFSARGTRADSIHSSDLKFDSFTSAANSCDLECVLNSDFIADRGEILALFSDRHSEFPANAQVAWVDWAGVPGSPFGFPIASHSVRREGDGNSGSTAVPEPGSLLLASLGLVGVFLLRKKYRSSSSFPAATL
jgi:hypothetical protein